jgi:hypothetical protein
MVGFVQSCGGSVGFQELTARLAPVKWQPCSLLRFFMTLFTDTRPQQMATLEQKTRYEHTIQHTPVWVNKFRLINKTRENIEY